jgi:aryl-alcohol dehydrogenase-like predicted oxidoreductase
MMTTILCVPDQAGRHGRQIARFGGGGSHRRTCLRPQFPCSLGKYREILAFDVWESETASHSRRKFNAFLAWVLAQGEDIVPIPGTKRRRYVEENIGALDVRLTPAELGKIDSILPPGAAAGPRYPERAMRTINR